MLRDQWSWEMRADRMGAVVGAVYRDGGVASVRRVMDRLGLVPR